MGRSTTSSIINETCKVIWETLQPDVLKVPTRQDWLATSSGFHKRWNFPHCIGAIDGKHVVIQAPRLSGSFYFNYKHQHSIVLLAACDDQYRFTLVDIGAPGRNSDGGIFANSAMGKAMERNTLNIPPPEAFNSVCLPYVFVADEAFPLKSYMMRPFPRGNIRAARSQDELERAIYNYRLCRARRLIENVFGIWSVRWRIFRRPIIANTENVVLYVQATICLHNWLRNLDCTSPENQQYNPPGFADRELDDGSVEDGQWRSDAIRISGLREIGKTGSNMYRQEAAQIRTKFMKYFSSPEGSVSWQLRHVLRGNTAEK